MKFHRSEFCSSDSPLSSVTRITVVLLFFRWLFGLFPMVTPYPTTTAMLKGALKRVTWHECRSMRPQKTSFTTELNFLQKSTFRLLPMHQTQHTRRTTQNKHTNTWPLRAHVPKNTHLFSQISSDLSFVCFTVIKLICISHTIVSPRSCRHM